MLKTIFSKLSNSLLIVLFLVVLTVNAQTVVADCTGTKIFICEYPDENPFNCPRDCEFGGSVCGDGKIDPGEDSTNCPQDVTDDSCVFTNGGVEACDNVDNDCDGIVDDIVEENKEKNQNQFGVCANSRKKCVDGAWQEDLDPNKIPGYSPTAPDGCDGKDSDCDDDTDEDWFQLAPIIPDAEGECKDNSLKVYCKIDKATKTSINLTTPHDIYIEDPDYMLQYVAKYNDTTEDTCDNADNDCDGEKDEVEDLRDHAKPLTENKGVCGTFKRYCDKGTWIDDATEIFNLAPKETPKYNANKEASCDKLDNDCDGEIDEMDDLKDQPEGQKDLDKIVGVCEGVKGYCDKDTGDWIYDPVKIHELDSDWIKKYNPDRDDCDKEDNDCDDIKNEDANDPKNPTIEFNTKQLGMCKLSTRICNDDTGKYEDDYTTIIDERYRPFYEESEGGPIDPSCDDGIDNDCDGIKDACEKDDKKIWCEAYQDHVWYAFLAGLSGITTDQCCGDDPNDPNKLDDFYYYDASVEKCNICINAEHTSVDCNDFDILDQSTAHVIDSFTNDAICEAATDKDSACDTFEITCTKANACTEFQYNGDDYRCVWDDAAASFKLKSVTLPAEDDDDAVDNDCDNNVDEGLAPVSSNINPAGGSAVTYSENQAYTFSTTWRDGVDVTQVTVTHDFGGTSPADISISGSNGNAYTLSKQGLNAGTYTWSMDGTDPQGNNANTGSQTFIVNKATPVLTITLDQSSVTFGTQTTASCGADTTQVTTVLKRDGNTVSNPEVAPLGANTYTYTCDSVATTNFKAQTAQSKSLTVNKKASAITALLDLQPSDKTIQFGNSVELGGQLDDPTAGTVTINRDSNLESSGPSTHRVTKSSLAVGTYVIQAVFDGNDNYIGSTDTVTLTVEDTTNPSFNSQASSQTYEYATETISQDLTATDLSGIASYIVDDNTNFQIDSNGLLKNKTLLAVGSYSITVTATDGQGNQATTAATITVADSVDPVITNGLSNQNVEFGDSFSQDVDATDVAGIQSYTINDITNFQVDTTTGVVTNKIQLAVGSYPITVTATDNHLRTQTTSATITVADGVDPVFTTGLINQNVEFGDSFSQDLDATDLSGIASYVIDDTTNFQVDANGVVANKIQLAVGTYNPIVTATDNQGRTQTTTATITVADGLDPVFTTGLTSDTIQFATQGFSKDLDATDLSGIASYVIDDTTNFQVDANGIVTNKSQLAVASYPITVTATDNQGNSNTTSATITVQDTTDPVFTQNVQTETVQFATQGVAQTITATDAAAVTYTVNDTNFAIDANTGDLTNDTQLAVGVYNIQVTATDAHARTATSTGVITVQDTTDPVFTQNVQTQTIQFATQGVAQTITATDAAAVTYTVNDTNFAIDANTGALTNDTQLAVGVYNIQVTATDAHARTATSTGVITVQDTTDPVFTANVQTETVQFATQGVAQTITATDAAAVTYTVNDTNFAIDANTGALTNNTKLAVGVYNIQVTATDAHARTATSTGVITVQDTTAPEFEAIATSDIEYGSEIVQQVTATDASGISNYAINNTNFTINSTGSVQNATTLAVGEHNIKVTATDNNAQQKDLDFTLTVVDTIAPTFTTGVTTETKEFAQQEISQQLVATDLSGIQLWGVNDSNFNISGTGLLTNNTQLAVGTYNIEVTVTDNNGVTANSTGVITVEDKTAPAVFDSVTPAPTQLGDDVTLYVNVTDASTLGQVFANISGTLYEMTSPGGNTFNVTLTSMSAGTHNVQYLADDIYDNLNDSVTDSFDVQDTQTPAVTNSVIPATPEFGSNVEIRIDVTDLSPIAQVFANVSGTLYTMNVETSNTYLANISGLAVGAYNVQYLANDSETNLNDTVTDSFTVQDTTKPVFDVPLTTETVQFSLQGVSQDINASDVSGIASYSVNDSNFVIDANGILTNNTQLAVGTYELNVTAVDNEGNAQSSFGTITVEDTTKPTFSAPVTTETKQFAQQNVAQQVIANDSSGISSYSVNDSINFQIDANGLLTNNTQLAVGTYNLNVTAVDNEGNAQSSFGVVTVEDTTKPTFSAAVTTETREFAQQEVAQQVTAVDVSGIASYSVNDSNFAINSTGYLTNASQLAIGDYNLNVTATDNEGNSESSFGVITVQDTTDPVFTADVLNETKEFTTQGVAQTITATDAAVVTYTVNDTNFAIDANTGVLTNATILAVGTYNIEVTATDAHSRTATSAGTIIVQDTTLPVFDVALTTETKEFATEGISQDLDASDASGILSYSVNDSTNFSIDGNGVLTNATQLAVGTYNLNVTAIDNEGNAQSSLGVITVQDTTLPVFDVALANENKEFATQGVSQDLDASDASGILSYSVNDSVNFAIDSNGILTNATQLAVGTYDLNVTAVDNEGNAQSSFGTITVADSTKPTFSQNVQTETKEFAQQEVAQQVTADDPSGILSYSVNDSNFAINNTGYLTNNTELAVGDYNLNVTAIDNEGNAQSSFGVITVEDNTQPSITTGVTTETREFAQQEVAQQLAATDAAGIQSWAVNDSNFAINSTGFLSNSTQLAIGDYNLEVTVTDGNSVTNTSTGVITVQDTTDPVFTLDVQNETKEFTTQGVSQTITATDATAVTYTVNDTNFTIDANTGVLTNATVLAVGTYNLEVTATDAHSRTATSAGTITVQDTTAPTVTNSNVTNPVELTNNLTIRVDVTDASTISQVYANISGQIAPALFELTFDGSTYKSIIEGLGVGSYNIQYVVNDTYNNLNDIVTDSFVIEDTTLPTFVTSVTTETKEFAQQEVAQQLNATDASGILSYSVNDSNFAINNTGYLTNNTELAVGDYNLNITAIDNEGNAQSSFGVITVQDTTTPSITTGVTTETREFAQQEVAQQLAATDAAGIQSWAVNDSNFAINSTGFLSNNTELAIGDYNLEVTVTDGNSVTNTSTGVITVQDTTDPVFTADVQNETKEFTTQGVAQTITATDAAAVTYTVSDTNFTIDANTGVLTNATVLAVGTYNLEVTATDAHSRTATSAGTITVQDTTDPVFTTNVVTESVEFTSQGVAQTITATDAAAVTYTVNDTNFTIDANTGALTNNTVLAVGTYNIQVTATDANSNTATSTGVITVQDTTLPVFDVALTTETKEFAIQGVSQDLDASDASGISSYSVNDSVNFAIDSNGVLTNNTILAVGTYNLNVTAIDNEGNAQSSFGIITVQDTIAPAVFDSVILPSTEFNGNVDLRVNVTDLSALSKVFAVVDGTYNEMSQESGNTYLVTLTAPSVATHNVQYVVNDTYNNVNNSLTDSFTVVDSTVPAVTASIIATPNELGSNVEIRVDVTDLSTISSVLANVSGTLYSMSLESGSTYLATVSGLAVNNYNVQYLANDTHGNLNNSLTDSFAVTDTTAPTVSNSVIPASTVYENNVEIRVDVTDLSTISSVQANVSGTLYSMSLESGSTYLATVTQPNAGSYNVQYVVNDTYNNVNDSLTDSFTVTKADPNVQLLFDGFETNITVIENAQVNLTVVAKGTALVHIIKNGTELNNGASPQENISTFVDAGTYNITAVSDGDSNYNTASKTLYIVVEPNVVHDVAIESFTFSNNVGVDQDVALTVDVKNEGTISESTTLRLFANGSEVDTKAISLLEPNTSIQKIFTWHSPDFEIQNYELKVVLDIVTDETDSADNTNTKFINVNGVHEISIDSISIDKSTVYLHDTITITANVTNNGDVNESNVPLEFKDINGGTIIQNLNLDINKGATEIVQFTWQPSTKNFHTVKVLTTLTSDTNVSNNEKSDSVFVYSVKDSINLSFVSETAFPQPSETVATTFYTWVNIDSLIGDVVTNLNMSIDTEGLTIADNQDSNTDSFKNFAAFDAFESDSFFWELNAGAVPTTKNITVSLGYGADKLEVTREVSIS